MDVKATLTNDMENIVSKTMIISVAAIICMGGRQSTLVQSEITPLVYFLYIRKLLT